MNIGLVTKFISTQRDVCTQDCALEKERQLQIQRAEEMELERQEKKKQEEEHRKKEAERKRQQQEEIRQAKIEELKKRTSQTTNAVEIIKETTKFCEWY